MNYTKLELTVAASFDPLKSYSADEYSKEVSRRMAVAMSKSN